MMTCLSGVETVARSSASNEVTRQTITCQHHANDVLPAGWLTTRSEVGSMAEQTCKDCKGRGYFGHPDDDDGAPICMTCKMTGRIHRTGPYRLADGTWSDGIDRTHQVRAYGFNKANPTRWTVNRIGESWEAYQYDSERESSNGHFGTHAEAIRYADHHARTTKNGDNNA